MFFIIFTFFVKTLGINFEDFKIEVAWIKLYTNMCYTEVDEILSLKLSNEHEDLSVFRKHAYNIRKVKTNVKDFTFPNEISNSDFSYLDDSLTSDIERARIWMLLVTYRLKLRKLSNEFKKFIKIDQNDIFKIKALDCKKPILQLYSISKDFEREINKHLENVEKLMYNLEVILKNKYPNAPAF